MYWLGITSYTNRTSFFRTKVYFSCSCYAVFLLVSAWRHNLTGADNFMKKVRRKFRGIVLLFFYFGSEVSAHNDRSWVDLFINSNRKGEVDEEWIFFVSSNTDSIAFVRIGFTKSLFFLRTAIHSWTSHSKRAWDASIMSVALFDQVAFPYAEEEGIRSKYCFASCFLISYIIRI